MKHARTGPVGVRVRGFLRLLSNDTAWRVWIVLLALLAWYIVTALELFLPLVLPSPQRVWNSFLQLTREGYSGVSLGAHISISITRLLAAYAAVCLTGIPAGASHGIQPKGEGRV